MSSNRPAGPAGPAAKREDKQRFDGALIGGCAGLGVALGSVALALAVHHLESGTRMVLVVAFTSAGVATGFSVGATRLEQLASRLLRRRRQG